MRIPGVPFGDYWGVLSSVGIAAAAAAGSMGGQAVWGCGEAALSVAAVEFVVVSNFADEVRVLWSSPQGEGGRPLPAAA